MNDNQLNELISLIQFETQKSFDFSNLFNKSDISDKNTTSKIHIMLREIEIPIQISMEENIVDISDKKQNNANNEQNDLDNIINKPFNLKYFSEKSTNNVKELKSKTLKTKIIGFKETIDSSEILKTGRTKIKLSPVLD